LSIVGQRSRKAVGDEAGPKNNPYAIGVVGRAFDILAIFSHARPSLNLGEVVTAVGLPKTTVFRVLSGLVERGYCECDPHTGKYSLGFELLRLANIRRRQTNVHDVAAPAMREIRNAVNETVILSVRAGDSRVHIDFVEGLHAMRRMADLGVPAPLYAGAASKVLLAGMEDEEIEAYLDRTDLTAFQDSTITDRALLWRERSADRLRARSRRQVAWRSAGGCNYAAWKVDAPGARGLLPEFERNLILSRTGEGRARREAEEALSDVGRSFRVSHSEAQGGRTPGRA
jgi:DNA-binding IclR family transcriptional regulator